MQNRMVYGVAILFSLVIYFLFVIPIDLSFHQKIGLLPIIIALPLFFAYLLVKKGTKFILVTIPYYFVGLFFLYRGIHLDDQLTIFEYSFIENGGSLKGVEYFFLYILISLFGVVLQFILKKKSRLDENKE